MLERMNDREDGAASALDRVVRLPAAEAVAITVNRRPVAPEEVIW